MKQTTLKVDAVLVQLLQFKTKNEKIFPLVNVQMFWYFLGYHQKLLF